MPTCAVGVREPEVRGRLGTTARMPETQMQIAVEEGALLAMLVELTGARRIVEVGTFTGYSSTAMALALPPGGGRSCADLGSALAAARNVTPKTTPLMPAMSARRAAAPLEQDAGDERHGAGPDEHGDHGGCARAREGLGSAGMRLVGRGAGPGCCGHGHLPRFRRPDPVEDEDAETQATTIPIEAGLNGPTAVVEGSIVPISITPTTKTTRRPSRTGMREPTR